MKGMVFTELTEFVENEFGFDLADEMIDAAKNAGGGIYTATGNYPDSQILAMLTVLQEKSGLGLDKLLQVFGRYLFHRILTIYPQAKESNKNSIEFISNVEGFVHQEVKKLYPDAELPTFIIEHKDETSLDMVYSSKKKLHDLAYGLMMGCADEYNEALEINYEQINENNDVRFKVRLQ